MDLFERDLLEHMLLDEKTRPIDLPVSILKAITNGFSDDNEIGRGAFAVVYKGVLKKGTIIAVKKLFETFDPVESRFSREIGCLMRVKHKNIVRFLGYCADTQVKILDYEGRHVMAEVRQRMLCFEYIPGGSLDNYITDMYHGLKWRERYKIIRGVCEGLDYLHEQRILHLDLKPGNILLDSNMVPKIADFGISRFFDEKQSRVYTTTMDGSIGYLAPEFFNGVITVKLDIYALGVIITEIMTGHKEYSSSLVQNVLEGWRSRLATSGEDTPLEQIRICAEICRCCRDANRNKRPEIKRIIEALNETESMMPDTQRIIEMLSDTESVEPDTEHIIELIEAGTRSSLAKKASKSNGVQRGTPTISAVESSEIMELNILERILAGTEEPSHLDLSLLHRITENFSGNNIVGTGGCADVYKAILRNGVVVVKRFFKAHTLNNNNFHQELKRSIMVRHQNIARFLGYCSLTEERLVPFGSKTVMAEIRERLLCFEYISNGSLDCHLTDELRGLEWHTRYEIIMGICKGLLYLHEEKHIIHMDVKPANILLDDQMVPKIIDFGLSRLSNYSDTDTTSTRLVSVGYCAPEYLLEGISSIKSDIYSMGVVITEVVTGSKRKPNITKTLQRWRHRWNKSSKHTPLSHQQVTKCLELAQRCTQNNPARRPDILEIIDELYQIDTQKDLFQVVPCFEDMLGIEPLELHFLFEVDQQVSHIIELINDTDDYFAFVTETGLIQLQIQPGKGIVPPRSKCSVTVMMQPLVNGQPKNHYKEEITVMSTRVDGCLGMDITEDMFLDDDGKVVDEVNVMVCFSKPSLAEDS